MSSTLYDFIRDNESSNQNEHMENMGQGERRQYPGAHGENRGDALDQTGLEVDTEIDFLDTQQLEYI